MARPKKQTVDYFPHYATSGKTMYVLEAEFGNDGYSFWFKLLELLCTSEGHYYDYSNPTSKRFMLAKTRLNEDIVIKILNMLADLEAIDFDLWYEDQVIWSQNLITNLTDVYRRRNCGFPSKPVLCKHKQEVNGVSVDINPAQCNNNPPQEDIIVDINPQSKVKESKVNKTIVEDSKLKEIKLDEIEINLDEFKPEDSKPTEPTNKRRPTQQEKESCIALEYWEVAISNAYNSYYVMPQYKTDDYSEIIKQLNLIFHDDANYMQIKLNMIRWIKRQHCKDYNDINILDWIEYYNQDKQ